MQANRAEQETFEDGRVVHVELHVALVLEEKARQRLRLHVQLLLIQRAGNGGEREKLETRFPQLLQPYTVLISGDKMELTL